jgi:WD40 repeat protein
MRRWITAVSVAAAIWPATAQPQGFRGSVTGFVYAPASRSVRPLLGVRGAASMGSALLDQVDWASVAPGGRAALAVKDGQVQVLLGLDGLVPAQVSVDGLIDSPGRVAWSRDGRFAAVYASSTGLLQRVRFGGAAPLADTPLDISSLGRVTALAINVAGDRIAFGIDSAGLYLVEAGQSPALISAIAQPAAAAFDDSGQRLYAVDAATGRILEFNSGAGEAEFAALDQADVAGLAVSGNGRYLLVTCKTAKTVSVYDIASRTLANTIPLDFAPSRLDRLSADPVFLLNGDKGSEWLLILDATETPGVYFVPAGSEEPL